MTEKPPPSRKKLRTVVLALLAAWGVYTGYVTWQNVAAWAHAKRLYESKRYAEAVPAFERSIALDPENAEAHFWLGNALGLSKQVERSIDPFRRAAELEPANAEYHSHLGTALTRLQRHAEAAEAFQKAVALRPADAGLRVDLGYAYYEQHRLPEAQEQFREALRIDPGLKTAQEALRFAESDAGKWQVFTSPEGGFSILMPGKPHFTTVRQTTPMGEVDRHVYKAIRPSVPDGYSIEYFDSPVALTPAALQAGLEHVTSTVSGPETPLGKPTSIVFNGRRGTELTAIKAGIATPRMRARTFIVGRRGYTIIAGTTREKAASAEVKRFFASLKFLPHR